MPKTFKEISDSLSLALEDIQRKKAIAETANNAAIKASGEYNNAVSAAQELREQLTGSLNSQLGATNDNVRVMTPKAG